MSISNIPDPILRGLMRYQDDGVMPGGFLQAVLRNDLQEAVFHADEESRAALLPICQYVHWEIPAVAHGSREAVDAWVAKFQAQRRAA